MNENEKDSTLLGISLGICCGILLAEYWRWKKQREEERKQELLNSPEFIFTSHGNKIQVSELNQALNAVSAKTISIAKEERQ